MRRLPRRGGLERLMNSIWVGSLSEAWRSTEEVMSVCEVIIRRMDKPSRASSSRMGAPPISKSTRPVGTLYASSGICQFG